jgi:HK97 family phage major capsid protein/HK97 family phage prohead protease
MKRAHALLEIRSADDERRTIDGIANTSDVDSYNTILEPQGAQFKLPMPVLYQHNARQPIGHVVEAKAGKDGIRVKIQIAKPGIAEFIDEAWALIKNGLVRGLSVGFEPLEEVYDKTFQGFRYPKWKWHELSTVTIPANSEATMSSVRAADEAVLAASGTRERASVVRLNSNPPASGTAKGKSMKTVRDHIAALDAKRTANDTRMDEIMQKASDEGRSRDAAETEEYDNLQAEQRSLDADIKAFQEREKSMVARAATVAPVVGREPAAAAKEQRTGRIEVRSLAPKGILPARMAIAMCRASNNPFVAAELAAKHWPDMPEVGLSIRAIVEAGDTTTSGWASQLVPAAQQLAGEFIDMYRDATIVDRIPGLRRVPFNVAVPIRTAAGTFQWVGEAAAKPVTSETFSSISLTWAKIAAITVITQELAKFSSPSAEVLIRDSMVKTLVAAIDTKFISTDAAVSGVSPAGILNGISGITPSATTMAAFRVDLNNMLNNMTANKIPLTQIVLLMSSTTALAFSLANTSLGVNLFPNITTTGGTLLGMPVVVSEAVGTKLIALNPSDILLAEDPGVSVTASTEATIEMESTPAVGEQSPPTTQSVLKSMYQNNMIAIRAEQFKTWARARSTAVEYINAPAYVPGT